MTRGNIQIILSADLEVTDLPCVLRAQEDRCIVTEVEICILNQDTKVGPRLVRAAAVRKDS